MNSTYTKKIQEISDGTYERAFWNAMRGGQDLRKFAADHNIGSQDRHILPVGTSARFKKKMKDRSVFRSIASVFETYDTTYNFIARDTDNVATWISENSQIPVDDGMEDFDIVQSRAKTLGSILKLENSFINDYEFDIEEYLTDRISRTFSRAEDNGFINGNGVESPFGILHPEHGALTGVETQNLHYDDAVSLFFSVDSEYRENGTWLMNDETAFYLRELKDDSGNYLWRGDPNVLLGRPVRISNYMPGAESGKSPVAFGDFSYYWIVGRSPIEVSVLAELFQGEGKTGYFTTESLDGFLIRRKAVKTVSVK